MPGSSAAAREVLEVDALQHPIGLRGLLLGELFFLDSKTYFRQRTGLVKDNSVGCVSYDRRGKIHALMGAHFDWRDV